MTEFAGVQDQKLDAPNPDAAPYKDPMQWWYDMSQAQQDQFREERVALLRHIGEVTGVSAITSNAGWETPWNPMGINPTVWNEYKRLTKEA